MQIKLYIIFLVVLALMINCTDGQSSNKTKSSNNRHNKLRNQIRIDRIKRSLDDNETPFWPQRGRRLSLSDEISRFTNDLESNDKSNDDVINKDPPFWGTRGRRDSSSAETYGGVRIPLATSTKYYATICKQCDKSVPIDNPGKYGYLKERRDDLDNTPFWGNRGRRHSDESDDDNYSPAPFWDNRGRRFEDNPFWGARGRRQPEDVPFWGNRGRRQNPKNLILTEDSPFWGNRGRREENDPFWGSRGRRGKSHRDDDETPFWGNRGRRQETEPFWGSRGRRENKIWRRENLKQVLLDAMNLVEDNIENLARSRRDEKYTSGSFWNSRGRYNQLATIFKGERAKYPLTNFRSKDREIKPSVSNTVLDDRVYAEQPHYIIVERSSRSSIEDAPFFISRGKKKAINYAYKAVRDRRSGIEELVKSVRNDPYYIARGKKDVQNLKAGNTTNLKKDLGKAKDLICATIDLILYKNSGSNKNKREINDNEYDRRTILKKLAAQLQTDPYFESKGKKNELSTNEDYLADFLNEVADKCTYKLN